MYGYTMKSWWGRQASGATKKEKNAELIYEILSSEACHKRAIVPTAGMEPRNEMMYSDTVNSCYEKTVGRERNTGTVLTYEFLLREKNAIRDHKPLPGLYR
jgi:hypothetical protein